MTQVDAIRPIERAGGHINSSFGCHWTPSCHYEDTQLVDEARRSSRGERQKLSPTSELSVELSTPVEIMVS